MPRRPIRETPLARAAFEVWCLTGRDVAEAARRLGLLESKIMAWHEAFGWSKRAETRDSEVAPVAEVAARDEAEDQITLARLLQRLGLKQLEDGGIATARDAIAAIRLGFEMWRAVRGLPTWIMEVVGADDETIRKMAAEAAKRLGLLDGMAQGGRITGSETGTDGE